MGDQQPAVNGAQVFIGCTSRPPPGTAALTKIRQLKSSHPHPVRSGW